MTIRPAIAVSAALLLGCEPVTSPVGPAGEGLLKIMLDQAPQDGAGLLLAVLGGPVDAMESGDGYLVDMVVLDSAQVRILVRGKIAPGQLAGLRVPDRRAPYTVKVLQAAAGRASGYVQHVQSAYAVRIGR